MSGRLGNNEDAMRSLPRNTLAGAQALHQAAQRLYLSHRPRQEMLSMAEGV
ncbi:MAG: hypothetical protein NW224_07200 [Leptolyngbyaceae cyanobacterium bins.302]|nr:hypothetical protein [Leptolyngbyaceae cyanobacterium bins.302]